jgi:diketogulonate reductase-like aldo/keto reductase
MPRDPLAPLTLNTGAALPPVGLGVFRAPPEAARAAVRAALEIGYRHIDTAQVYGNEAAVAAAIRDSGVPRDTVFVTTKIAPAAMAPDRIEGAIRGSVAALGGAPDLMLLHWPEPTHRRSAWAVLERWHRAGDLPGIGVSNFMTRHLTDLLAGAQVVPAVNQIELSPFLQQQEVRATCAAAGIAVAAYSPLTKGRRLDHPVLARLAARHAATPAQILLRWGLQSGAAVLPKTVRPERIAENLALGSFRLGAGDMAALDALEENLVTGWNPQGVV